MCGGPVLLQDYSHSNSEGEAGLPTTIGVLEGVVPSTNPSHDLRNAAVFVESFHISK